jgi:hypothetical protein
MKRNTRKRPTLMEMATAVAVPACKSGLVDPVGGRWELKEQCHWGQGRILAENIATLAPLALAPLAALREIVCALIMNRPVRTRMQGGVGRVG